MDRLISSHAAGQASSGTEKNGWTKNVRRELHRFIIQDIKIVIPDDGRPQNKLKSQNFYSRPKHQRPSQDGQITAEDFRRISSPDSGLESDNNGRFRGSASTPNKRSNDATQDRIDNLRRLAFKAKYADSFTLERGFGSGTATPDLTKNKSTIYPYMSPLITNILPPISPLEDKPEPNWQDRGTTTVRSGALHFPSNVSNGVSCQEGKTPSRVSFYEDSDFYSSEDSSNETGIFPFIDINEETPVHETNNLNVARELNIVNTDDDIIYAFPSTATDSDITQSLSPKFPTKDGKLVPNQSPDKWPQKFSDEAPEIHHDEGDAALQMTPLSSENLYEVPDFSNSHAEINLGSPSSDERNGDHIFPSTQSANNPNEMDPDFCRVLDADDVMAETGKKDSPFLLLDHNSTPILRKKTEMKDSQNPSPSRKGSLRKAKARVIEDSGKTFSEGSTQTKTTLKEDSCVQQGVAIASLSIGISQTDRVKSAIASTQTTVETKTPTYDKECQAEVSTMPIQTQNMGVQVVPRTYTSVAQCQTPKTETTESSFQTNKITQKHKIIQVLPDKRAVYCSTDKVEVIDSSTETKQVTYSALGTQTPKAKFSEAALQTDSKLPANVWNRLTQTASRNIQDAQSQIDSSFTGRAAESQTVKLSTEAIECQTLEIMSEQNSTQTEIGLATMSVQTEDNLGLNDRKNAATKLQDLVSDEEMVTIKRNSQLNASANRPQSLPVRNQVPRTSTPSSIATDSVISPRGIPQIEVASPDSSIHVPVGQKKNFMRSPVSTPGSLLSPRASEIEVDEDDKAGRLRRIALQAKIARSFAEGTPPSSPRDQDQRQNGVLSTKIFPSRSNTPGSSTVPSPRDSKTGIKTNPARATSSTVVSPRDVKVGMRATPSKTSCTLSSPRDTGTKTSTRPPLQLRKESPTSPLSKSNLTANSAGLKPILAKPKIVTADRPLSGSSDSKQKDIQLLSQKTGSRVRIKEFDLEQQSSKTPTPSIQTESPRNNRSTGKQDSGGSTDSLLEELEFLNSK